MKKKGTSESGKGENTRNITKQVGKNTYACDLSFINFYFNFFRLFRFVLDFRCKPTMFFSGLCFTSLVLFPFFLLEICVLGQSIDGWCCCEIKANLLRINENFNSQKSPFFF